MQVSGSRPVKHCAAKSVENCERNCTAPPSRMLARPTTQLPSCPPRFEFGSKRTCATKGSRQRCRYRSSRKTPCPSVSTRRIRTRSAMTSGSARSKSPLSAAKPCCRRSPNSIRQPRSAMRPASLLRLASGTRASGRGASRWGESPGVRRTAPRCRFTSGRRSPVGRGWMGPASSSTTTARSSSTAVGWRRSCLETVSN